MNRRTFLTTLLIAPIVLKSIKTLAIYDEPIKKIIHNSDISSIPGIQWIDPVLVINDLKNIPNITKWYDNNSVLGCYIKEETAYYIRIPYKQKYLFRTLTHTKWVQFSGINI